MLHPLSFALSWRLELPLQQFEAAGHRGILAAQIAARSLASLVLAGST
jgi:hypothetical protein